MWHILQSINGDFLQVLKLPDHLSGLVVKMSASRAEYPGFESCLHQDFFGGSSHTSDLKIGTPVLSCKAPGVIGSVLGLVGPVSVYCDCVRWKV